MKQTQLLLIFFLFLLACQSNNATEVIPVHTAGALHQIMQEGNIDAQIDLDSLSNKPNLFGLGAAEKLKGEFLIWNGKAFLTTVAGSGLATYTGFRKKASLLVYAQVAKWDSIPLPQEVSNIATIEPFLLEKATKAGIDISKPFPFLLKGQPNTVSWHVIDWDEEDPVHTHAKHQKAGMKSGWKNTPTEILGFYSPQAGIFTHKDSHLHLHTTTLDRRLVAHLDDAEGIDGMLLFLPAISNE